ncbi:unnamed protein product [Candidula unifasciata]|uniref:Uncharacterized protein n=1 Tax=Candidula unifasciata TaxID=100452 RepID=A0A8S3YY68_9EUPU|nr:unnamed protein product [Candidula unifasciata]
MASSLSRSPVDVTKRRPLLLRSKQLNGGLLKASARKILMSISQMSPEAQRAMTLTQEDAKENVAKTENTKQKNKRMQCHDQSRDMSSLCTGRDQIIDAARDSRSGSRLLAGAPGVNIRVLPRSRRITASSFGTSVQTGTFRSRSTLSITERNNSISDNTDSYYNYKSAKKIDGTINRNNHHIKDDDSISNSPTTSEPKPDVVQSSTDESNNNNIGEVNNNSELPKEEQTRRHENVQAGVRKEEQSRRPESFVLALDRALEDKCISRLSGDITNTAGISEVGRVRALDGGRLTNAQEIVVNVRYDDDRELIFHDNDEESLNNARATSNIRINLWLEYNEGFQSENIVEDIKVFSTNYNEGQNGQTSGVTTYGNPPSLPKPRGINLNRPASNRTNALTKQTSKTKSSAVKTDLNNNKINCKPKTNIFKNGRNNLCSKNGSTEICDGSKRQVSSFRNGIKK